MDGTALSERSLPWVLRIAPRARIVLGGAYTTIPMGSSPGMDMAPYIISGDEEVKRHLKHTAVGLRPEPRVVIGLGSPAGVLLEMAKDEKCDLIAIASQGGAKLKRRMFGGTTENLLHHSTIPIMVVSGAGQVSRPKERIRRIAIPLDGSESAESILPWASQIAHDHKAELLLIHCFPGRDQRVRLYGSWETPALSAVNTQDLERRITGYRMHLEKHFKELSSRLGRQRLRAKVVWVTGSLPEGIVKAARQHRADLFMMCAHGHGALRHLLQGSLVSKLIQASAIPVIVLRSDAELGQRKLRHRLSKKAGKNK